MELDGNLRYCLMVSVFTAWAETAVNITRSEKDLHGIKYSFNSSLLAQLGR